MTSVRAEVGAWLDEHWDPRRTTRAWWELLHESGWAFPPWPVGHGGRALPPAATAVVHDEMAARDVLGPPAGIATTMGAPAVLAFGTPEQQHRWLPVLGRGLENWSQFFSEPGAGSDLASVQTRAVRDGGGWVVNGQKVWSSRTGESDRALLLARTDADAPRHRGLSFFVIDVHQPGVEVRPIRQMNGAAEFNEVFLTDARVADDRMLGAPGDGWTVALHILAHERAEHAGGGSGALKTVTGGERRGFLDRPAADARDAPDMGRDSNRLPISQFEQLLALARAHDRVGDPVVRQRLADVYALTQALRWTDERARASAASPGPEASVSYVGGVRLVRLYRDLLGALAGPDALLSGTPVSDSILTAPCHGIQGGAEQIQLNIMGERVLGLPREPREHAR